jgi:two-component system cell cycle response regulator
VSETTCLIIDDSATIRQHVQQVLTARGVFSNCLLASDGIEGFKLLTSSQVDLVLCDLIMPGIDGFKLLAMKQTRPELHEVPVIMLTGKEEIRDKVRALDEGASDYLVKPFDDAELVARVRVHLKLKLLQDELREKNHRLDEMSRTDALTGLANVRQLKEAMRLELMRAERHKSPLAFVMLDVDHFKPLNDTYGHQAGDLGLRAVADILKAGVRQYDVVARYGGDEFGLLLPQTDEAGALTCAERIRIGVKHLKIEGIEKPGLTASIGVGVYPHPGVASVDELIKVADAALYEAKRGGRNRVVVAR